MSKRSTPIHRGSGQSQKPLRKPRKVGSRATDDTRSSNRSETHGIHETVDWLVEQISSSDLQVEKIPRVDSRPGVLLVYVTTLIDPKSLTADIYEPLRVKLPGDAEPEDPRARIPNAVCLTQSEEILTKILEGYVALFREGHQDAFLVNLALSETRQVDEPTTEVQLFGPKVGFIEQLETNLNLVRRRLVTKSLRVQEYSVGRRSNTQVAILYLEDVADPNLLFQLDTGIRNIDIDYIRDSIDIHELVVGKSLTPFPLSQRTERPDKVVSALTNGRVAILVDGSTFALLLPTTLAELYKDGENYLQGPLVAGIVRWSRVFGIGLATIVPSLYVALLGVDLHLFPSDILLTVAATREGIPYPILLETIVMLLILDFVIEATVQSPPSIGQSLTIVGSLIIGQAAVQAQLASQLMVIVLAINSVGTLLSPSLPLGYASRIVKYPLTVLSGLLGLYGLTMGLLLLTIHLVTLKSMGTPYLTPMGPIDWTYFRYYSLGTATKGARRKRIPIWSPQDDDRTGGESG